MLSINNSNFSDWLPLINPSELEIKKTTDTTSLASFLDLYLDLDTNGQLSTRIYDRWDDFKFEIINFPHMEDNIPSSPAYGDYTDSLRKRM